MGFASKLLARIEAVEEFPPPSVQEVNSVLQERKALYGSDITTLRMMHSPQWDRDRRYVHDPLAASISAAYADYLFGEAPKFTANDETAEARLNEIVEENRLDANLRDAHERYISAEGEAWWRIRTDKLAARTPIIDWLSRECAIPMFISGRLVAVAFWRELECLGKGVVHRYVEVHSDETVLYALYRGTTDKLGDRIDLNAHFETEGLADEWHHGLPMLAGRITNGPGNQLTLGRSDYDRVIGLLLVLDEAVTIGAENVKLVAKKRVMVSGSLVKADGSMDVGAEIIQVTQESQVLGEDQKPPIVPIEFSFDAEPLIAYDKNLVHKILNRVGLVPQIVGDNVDGQAETGTAIRLRFLPTVLAATGRSREYQASLPKILNLTMQVDSLPLDNGGYNMPKPDGLEVSVEFGSILPEDEQEIVTTQATAVAAEIRSRRLAVREQHPEWSEQEVDDEVEQILTELSAPMGSSGGGEYATSPAGAGVTPGIENNSAY